MKITKHVCALTLLAALSACNMPPAEHSGQQSRTTTDKGGAAKGGTTEETPVAEGGDGAIRALHPSVAAVDHMAFATPPKLVLTLEASGWNEAATFYAFASDASVVLQKMAAAGLIPKGEDFVFILRADSTAGGATNYLHLQVPADAIGRAIGAQAGAAEALLREAGVEFNGSKGRTLLAAFCNDGTYSGAAGMLPSAAFCERALAS